jgi:hypothetical protein
MANHADTRTTRLYERRGDVALLDEYTKGDLKMGGGKGFLAHTYELHANPPSRMLWKEYEGRMLAEWAALLNSEMGCDEKRVHKFLVKHPSMIPGAYSMTGPSGHSPFPMAVLSESALSGLGMKVPDFIWLSKDSVNFTPVFIEICDAPRVETGHLRSPRGNGRT